MLTVSLTAIGGAAFMSWALAAAPATGTGGSAPAIRVLFLGNSQLSFCDVPRMVQALAESAPPEAPRIEVDRHVVGGASLKSLWESRGTRIEDGRWDFVVIQEHYHQSEKDFLEYAAKLHELITRCGARTILLATASVTEHYSADCRFPESTRQLNDMQIAFGKRHNIPVAAGGYAWMRYLGPSPKVEQVLDLYAADKGHPGSKGSYINACLLYACLTGRDPTGLVSEFKDIKGGIAIPRPEAEKMQQAAWAQHQESTRK